MFRQRIDNHYNLGNINHFETPFVRTVYNKTESISNFGPKNWDITPEEYKKLNNSNSFNPIQDGLFPGCSRMGEQKDPPLNAVTHILQ